MKNTRKKPRGPREKTPQPRLLMLDFLRLDLSAEDRWQRLLELQTQHGIETWVPGAVKDIVIDSETDTLHEGYTTPEAICTRKDDYRRVFFLTDRKPTRHEQEYPERYICRGFGAAYDLWPLLQETQREYQGFLQRTMDRAMPDLDFINNRLEHLHRQLLLIPSRDAWRAELSIQPHTLYNIEDCIDIDLVNFLLSAGASNLEFLRMCGHCHHFFLGARATKKWCSDECRRNYHNRENIRTGKMAASKRKRFGWKKRPDTPEP